LKEDLTSLSKFLSLVLRHAPETIGLSLDEAGWANIETLLQQANAHGKRIDREILEKIVATSDKRRFVISDDELRIRANQGHSVNVDLGLEAIAPPGQLFHGTASRFLAAIQAQGLTPQSRQHVHLSADVDTARVVGQRHGSPVVLRVDAAKMHEAGHVFYRSLNGVWLTQTVPAEFLLPLASDKAE